MTDETISAQPADTRPVHERLSRREYEVFVRIAKGTPQKVIGDELHMERNTVSALMVRAKKKMGMKSLAEAAVYAHKAGIGLP